MAEQKIISERQRKLQQVGFAPSQLLTRDLPRDTVLKFLNIRLSGGVVTTYASGTPVADAQSTMDNLISRIDIIVNGNRTVKNVRPHLLHMQQIFAKKIQGERKASAGAAATLNPTVDGGFVYGTTTQITSVAETVLLAFENIMASENGGRENTWLNLKGVASAEIRFTTAAFNSLLGFGNTAPVVYSASTLAIDISTIEAQDVPAEIAFSDWKQTTRELQFGAQTSEFLQEINRGNFLQGLMFFAREGQAGTATTASGKLASNLLVTNLKLVLNGQTTIKANTWLELQAENRSNFGIQAPYAGNVSRIDGVAYFDFLKNGQLASALDVRPPLVDQVHLSIDTRDAASVSYTTPASLTVMTNEIVMPK